MVNIPLFKKKKKFLSYLLPVLATIIEYVLSAGPCPKPVDGIFNSFSSPMR